MEEYNPCKEEQHIPHDPEPTYEQLAIQGLVDELYRRLKY